jgi:hypothetical protein
MTSPILPDYVPVPRASLGPAVNDQGERIELGYRMDVHP